MDYDDDDGDDGDDSGDNGDNDNMIIMTIVLMVWWWDEKGRRQKNKIVLNFFCRCCFVCWSPFSATDAFPTMYCHLTHISSVGSPNL